MHFKLIVAFVDDDKTAAVMEAARQAGATGSTIINNARGEGLEPRKTFLGLELETQRDVLLFVVEEHLCRRILEDIGKAGDLDEEMGTGIAVQLDVEDAIGVSHQIQALSQKVEEQL